MSDHGPWRDPYAYRPLVAVRRNGLDVYHLAIAPGAEIHDLIAVAATLPSVVYTDIRIAGPYDPTAILTFRALPTAPDGPMGPPAPPHQRRP